MVRFVCTSEGGNRVKVDDMKKSSLNWLESGYSRIIPRISRPFQLTHNTSLKLISLRTYNRKLLSILFIQTINGKNLPDF